MRIYSRIHVDNAEQEIVRRTIQELCRHAAMNNFIRLTALLVCLAMSTSIKGAVYRVPAKRTSGPPSVNLHGKGT